MANKVVIVESPTKARTLKKLLGSEYQVLASVGHIIDLPKNKLGVNVEGGGFEPEYTHISGKEKVIEELRRLPKAPQMNPALFQETIAWNVPQAKYLESLRDSTP